MSSRAPVPTLSQLAPLRSATDWVQHLPAFVQVCEQLAEAHAEGRVHGGLAPALVANAADTVTWLVRWPEARPPVPGYTAPEQYRRQPLTPATDVYALGGLLYFLLTGRAPIRADTPQHLQERTLDGEVTSPQQHNPTVPAHLAAVCLRALAVNPKARYATAQELLAALPRQARPVRAWPRWLFAGAAAGIILSVIGVLTAQSVTATPSPEPVRPALAVPILPSPDFASVASAYQRLDDLAERTPQLARTERQAYLAEVGSLRSRALAEPTTAGTALELLGQLYWQQQQRTDAEQCWTAALGATTDPLTQARLQRYLARVHLHTDRPDQAEIALKTALKHLGEPTTSAGKWESAQVYQALGDLYWQREVANAALDAYTPARTLLAELTAAQPERTDYGLALAQVQTSLGNLYRKVKLRIDATAAYSAAVAVLEGLPANRAQQWRYQAELGRARYEWAVHDHDAKLAAAARTHLERARPAQLAVLAVHPHDPDWLRTLIATELLLAQVTQKRGDYPAARGVLATAKQRCDELLQRQPLALQDRHDLGLVLAQMALVENADKNYAAMLPLIQAARAVRTALADEQKKKYSYVFNAAWAWQWEGHAFWHLKRTDEALAAYTQACRYWEPLAKGTVNYVEPALAVAETRNFMGTIRFGQKNYVAALAEFNWAEPYLVRVLVSATYHPRFEPAVRTMFMGRAKANMAQGWYQDALPLWEGYYRWTKQMPADLRIRRAICYAYLNQLTKAELDAALAELDDDPDATALYNAGCALAVAAARSTPADAERRATRAVQLLRAAGAAGTYARDQWQTDPDLVGLHKRADFRQWLHDLDYTERLGTPRE